MNMNYYYCLYDKTEENAIRKNVYRCDTVLNEQCDRSAYKYVAMLNAPATSNIHGVAQYWCFDFTDGSPKLRRKNNLDLLPDAKTSKRGEIKESWINSTVKGHPLCYVITSVTDKNGSPIVMDCSEKDQNNIRTLLENMEDNKQTDEIIKDYHDNYHPVTIDQVREIKRCINQRGCELFKVKEQLYAQIDAANTLDELETIRWTMIEKHK